MAEPLDVLFERELTALHEAAAAGPALARRLGASREGSSDPDVQRLLEGVAYLGARVQARLDDEFPELTEALLGELYPQLLLAFPSCMLVQFRPKKDLQRLTDIPARTPMHTVAKVEGEECRYRTTAPLRLWPVALTAVQLRSVLEPFALPAPAKAAGALRLTLTCLDERMTFDRLARTEALGPLRLHLRGGVAAELYRMLEGTLGACLAESREDTLAVAVGPDVVQPGGFAAEDALIPWPPHGAPGFRLLLEYFAFRDKFLCVDLHGLERRAMAGCGRSMEVVLYLPAVPKDLERAVGLDNFRLFCVPAVNLFEQRCEPVTVDGTATEYRVDPTHSGLASMEIWSVESVRETRVDATATTPTDLPRLFGHRDGVQGYTLKRRPARGGLAGEEVLIGLCNAVSGPPRPGRSLLTIKALCTNRDRPRHLPFGDGAPALALEAGAFGAEPPVAVTAATAPLRPHKRAQRQWYLLSHLAMGHFSLLGGGAGAETLRRVLSMYDLREERDTSGVIAALVGVTARDAVARLPGARPERFCRGIEVILLVAPQEWNGALYLFAAVLARFLAVQAGVNSFVQTSVVLEGQSHPAARWPARSGTRPLL